MIKKARDSKALLNTLLVSSVMGLGVTFCAPTMAKTVVDAVESGTLYEDEVIEHDANLLMPSDQYVVNHPSEAGNKPPASRQAAGPANAQPQVRAAPTQAAASTVPSMDPTPNAGATSNVSANNEELMKAARAAQALDKKQRDFSFTQGGATQTANQAQQAPQAQQTIAPSNRAYTGNAPAPSRINNTQVATQDNGATRAPNNEAVSCIELAANAAIPPYIANNQCYELQGGNVIGQKLTIQGKLKIKAGRKVNVNPNVSITIVKGGELNIRGQVDMAAQSSLNIDDGGTLDSSGQIYLAQGAAINSRGNAAFRNIGRISLEPQAKILLTGATKFRTSGLLTIENASLELRQNVEAENMGTLKADAAAAIYVAEKARFINGGKIQLSKESKFNCTGNARFISRRQFTPEGTLSFEQQAIFENDAVFRQLTPSEFYLSGSSQVLNNNTFELGGRALLSNSARVLNDGFFIVGEGSNVRIAGIAMLINTGTFRNNGGNFIVDNKNNFVNEHIISGESSRSQGHNRASTSKAREDKAAQQNAKRVIAKEDEHAAQVEQEQAKEEQSKADEANKQDESDSKDANEAAPISAEPAISTN